MKNQTFSDVIHPQTLPGIPARDFDSSLVHTGKLPGIFFEFGPKIEDFWGDGLVTCGGRMFLYRCGHCGKTYRVTSTCKRRTCVFCSKMRKNRLLGAYLEVVKGFKWPVFLTLTLKSVFDEGLRDGIDRLIKAFTKLRHRKFWKVGGGVYSIEMTKTEKGWHIHLHSICDCVWMRQKDISKAWLDVTGDSYVVDIRRVRGVNGDRRKACLELVKYVSKLWELAPEDKSTIETALKGRKLIHSFGGVKVNLPPRGDLRCKSCGGPLDYIGEEYSDAWAESVKMEDYDST